MPLDDSVWQATIATLIDAGLDPTHPAFATLEIMQRAVAVLVDLGVDERVAVALVDGLVTG